MSKQKDGYVDRGMLAKAEWERQLRAKIEQREKDRSEQMLEIASSLEASAKPPEPPSMTDERQKALDAIQQDLFGGRICDRSHIPVLKEEDETSTEDDDPRPGSSGTSGVPGSSKKVSQPQQSAVSMSQYSTQATAETGDSGSDDALVSTFLEKHGLRDVNAKKRRFLRSTYPLHLAVQEGNPRLVVAILARGAKKEQKNSLGMTAEEVAKKSNKVGLTVKCSKHLVLFNSFSKFDLRLNFQDEIRMKFWADHDMPGQLLMHEKRRVHAVGLKSQ